MFRILAVFTILFAGAGDVFADSSGPFSFRVGTGYDFVSQEYFLEETSDDPDSLLESALLTREYLDDKKGFIYIKYSPDSAQNIKFETGWEQTPELYRAVIRADLKHISGSNRLYFDFDFDQKRNVNGNSEIGDEISVTRGQAKYRRKFSTRIESNIRLFAENVDFVETGDFVYDYYRFGGEAGLNIYSKGFNSLYISALGEQRKVADSSSLNYKLIRGYSGFYGILGKSNLSAELSLEKKDYNNSENQGDYWLTIASGDLKIPLNLSHYIRSIVSFEGFNFDENDYLSDDYILFKAAVLWEYEHNMATISAGPKVEIASISSDIESDDDYFEYLFQTGYDLFSLLGLFIITENQVGFRRYIHDPEFNSDFYFDRISIIGSAPIYRNLIADLLFSADWEWHKTDSDDNRLYLISASLTYKF